MNYYYYLGGFNVVIFEIVRKEGQRNKQTARLKDINSIF